MATAETTQREREMYATFREESSLTSTAGGDPYRDSFSQDVPARWKGKRFCVPQPVKGNGHDAMLDKELKLAAEGDVYLEPFMVERTLAKGLASSLPVLSTGKAFRPSAVLTGSLISPTPYDTDASAACARPKVTDDRLKGKKNLCVQPGHKGGFGYPLSSRSIGTFTLDYMADEYNPGGRLSRELRQKARDALGKAFVSTGCPGHGITPMPMGGPEPVSLPPIVDTGAATRKSAEGPGWKGASPTQRLGPGDYAGMYMPPTVADRPPSEHLKGWHPTGSPHARLSMRSVNPYSHVPHAPADILFTLLRAR
ncbi:hypothetical protein FOA52_004597 [Chlamydomonas sp. UWO 241]|nr:hypothetical protein FOA52_004597 [Chlamydomonas sp. UWO 241]